MTEQQERNVVVITGASSGIGRAAAVKLSAMGMLVVLAARDDAHLQETARACEQAGGYVRVQPTDVSKEADVERLAQRALDTFSRIDVWINNAGVAAIGRFDEVPLADHQQVIQTDLFGTLYGSYAALRQFHKQGRGTLINVASGLGKIAAPYYSSYVAAKFGVVGLTNTLRQELRENDIDDIHVCSVLPMAMDTPFFAHAANYTGHAAPAVATDYDPDDVADAIVGLVTHPQDEVVVGGAGRLALAAHSLLPGVVESVVARQTHKAQINQAERVPHSAGNVHEPTPERASTTSVE